MKRQISCFAALVISAFGSMPASATSDADTNCRSVDPAVAIPACTSIIGSRDVEPHTRAFAYFRRGVRTASTDREAAIRDYTSAIESYQQLDSRDAGQLWVSLNASQFHTFRGREYFNLRDYKRAMADYVDAIALDETSYLPRVSRGVLHFSLNEIDQAYADLNAAIKLNPTDSEAYSYRGRMAGKLGRFELGLTDMGKAIQLEPQNILYQKLWNKLQQDLLVRTFTTAASDFTESDLDGGYSRVTVFQ